MFFTSKRRCAVLLLIVLLLFCLEGIFAYKKQTKNALEKREFPSLIVNRQGEMTDSRGFEEMTSVTLEFYWAGEDEIGEAGSYRIRKEVFQNCSKLKSLIIPSVNESTDRITDIEDGAFEGCSDQLIVYCREGSELYRKLQDSPVILKDYVEYCRTWERDLSLKPVSDPFLVINEEGVLGACSGAAKLSDKEILCLPSEIKRIEHRVFRECYSIHRIQIPDSVEYIGRDAFIGTVTLYGSEGSVAEKYAKDHGLKYWNYF